ncbi:MAG: hypothetical protein GKS06_05590 [Acidobacteria bacterium]|nr:hypothetical protein [Acidobacteriota bacterium]
MTEATGRRIFFHVMSHYVVSSYMDESLNLPDITHLQFLVLSGLRDGTRAGRDLRALLADHGVRRSAPAFYQMMARLEDATLVAGSYETRVDNGQAIKERRYEVTPAGERAWEATREFYQGQFATQPQGGDGV